MARSDFRRCCRLRAASAGLGSVFFAAGAALGVGRDADADADAAAPVLGSPPSVHASSSSIPSWKILPERSVAKPWDLKNLGSETNSGWAAPKNERLSMTPVVVG